MKIEIGNKYNSFQEFEIAFNEFQKLTNSNYYIYNSTKIIAPYSERFKYLGCTLWCRYGQGNRKLRNTASIRKTSTIRQNCRSHIIIKFFDEELCLKVVHFERTHSHSLNEHIFKDLPPQRRLPKEIKKQVLELRDKGCSYAKIKNQLNIDGFNVTTRDIYNIKKPNLQNDFHLDPTYLDVKPDSVISDSSTKKIPYQTSRILTHNIQQIPQQFNLITSNTQTPIPCQTSRTTIPKIQQFFLKTPTCSNVQVQQIHIPQTFKLTTLNTQTVSCQNTISAPRNFNALVQPIQIPQNFNFTTLNTQTVPCQTSKIVIPKIQQIPFKNTISVPIASNAQVQPIQIPHYFKLTTLNTQAQTVPSQNTISASRSSNAQVQRILIPKNFNFATLNTQTVPSQNVILAPRSSNAQVQQIQIPQTFKLTTLNTQNVPCQTSRILIPKFQQIPFKNTILSPIPSNAAQVQQMQIPQLNLTTLNTQNHVPCETSKIISKIQQILLKTPGASNTQVQPIRNPNYFNLTSINAKTQTVPCQNDVISAPRISDAQVRQMQISKNLNLATLDSQNQTTPRQIRRTTTASSTKATQAEHIRTTSKKMTPKNIGKINSSNLFLENNFQIHQDIQKFNSSNKMRIFHKNYIINRNSVKNNKVYGRCNVRTCKFRFISCKKEDDDDNDSIVGKGSHNHPPNKTCFYKFLINDLIRRTYKKFKYSLSREQIFLNCLEELEDRYPDFLEFPKASRGFDSKQYLFTEKHRIREPAHLSDIHIPNDELTRIRDESFVLENLGTGNNESRIILFGLGTYVRQMGPIHNLYLDGTLSVTPNLFKQLYVVYTFKYGQMFPLFYAILSETDVGTTTYTTLLRLVKLKLENYNCIGNGSSSNNSFSSTTINNKIQFIQVDYNVAMINSITQVFPGTEIRGYFFHFSKAIFSYIQSQPELVALFKQKDSTTHALIRRVMGLPLVKPTDFRTCLIHLYNLYGSTTSNDTFDEFIRYLDTTWFGESAVFKYEMWTSYNKEERGFLTKNLLETFNRSFKARIKDTSPNIYKFIDSLKLMIKRYRYELCYTKAGTYKPSVLRKNVIRDETIQKIIHSYKNNEITDPLNFLDQITQVLKFTCDELFF